MIACAPREGSSEIRVQNLDEEMYTSQSFVATRVDSVKREPGGDVWELNIDKGQLRWESYVKAGYYVRVMANTTCVGYLNSNRASFTTFFTKKTRCFKDLICLSQALFLQDLV